MKICDFEFMEISELNRYKRFCDNKSLDYKEYDSLTAYEVYKDSAKAEQDFLKNKHNDLMEY